MSPEQIAQLETHPAPFLQLTFRRPEDDKSKKRDMQLVARNCGVAETYGWRVISVWQDSQHPWDTHVMLRSSPP